MPYIKQTLRNIFDPTIQNLLDYLKPAKFGKVRAGLLNYIFTRILHDLYGNSYSEINEAIGVLECCKLELYRRVAAPYEDEKIVENGDVK